MDPAAVKADYVKHVALQRSRKRLELLALKRAEKKKAALASAHVLADSSRRSSSSSPSRSSKPGRRGGAGGRGVGTVHVAVSGASMSPFSGSKETSTSVWVQLCLDDGARRVQVAAVLIADGKGEATLPWRPQPPRTTCGLDLDQPLLSQETTLLLEVWSADPHREGRRPPCSETTSTSSTNTRRDVLLATGEVDVQPWTALAAGVVEKVDVAITGVAGGKAGGFGTVRIKAGFTKS